MSQDKVFSIGNMLLVGRMGRPFGVKGFGRVHLLSQNPCRFFEDIGKDFFLIQSGRLIRQPHKLILEDILEKGSDLLLKWRGINSPEDLREVSGYDIYWDGPDDWVPEDPEMVRLSALIGMKVLDCETLHPVGTVSDFYERSGQDLLAIDAGGTEVLCPFVEPLVPRIDKDRGEVHVRWSIVGT